ncbi:MAG TPA: hypothetical protein DCW37_06695 [Cellvibrionales bacterium]|nr:hypothetical protein [Cellvibrionales bacterium]
MKIIGNGVIGIRRGRKCKILNIKTIWKLTQAQTINLLEQYSLGNIDRKNTIQQKSRFIYQIKNTLL